MKIYSFLPPDPYAKVAIISKQKTDFISVVDIVYCQSEGNYTRFYLADKKKMLVPKSLKLAQESLDSCGFVRIHRSYIINPLYLQSFTKGEKCEVHLGNGIHLQVSESRKDLIEQLIKSKTKGRNTNGNN